MPKLAIAQSREDSAKLTVLKLTGSLDVFSYLELKAVLEARALEFPAGRILVDLSQVGFIASSGWAVLIGFAKSFQRQNGVVAIVGTLPEVAIVYETMNLATLLPAYPDLAAGRRALAAPPGAEPSR